MSSEIKSDEFLNDKYNVLSHYKSNVKMGLFLENPIEFRPTPSEEDYRKGYLDRYFTQKKNSDYNLIYEIAGSQYQSLKKNPFYNSVYLKWSLGTNTNLENEAPSISDLNEGEITKASSSIPKIATKLKNKLEFYKKV